MKTLLFVDRVSVSPAKAAKQVPARNAATAVVVKVVFLKFIVFFPVSSIVYLFFVDCPGTISLP